MRTPQSPQRGKARKSPSIPLSVKLPPKKIREKFLIIYELKGCQEATYFLTEYYKVRRMRIILNGRMVPNKKSKRWVAFYYHNKAYFTKEGLNKRIVLHELYHHLVDCNNLELKLRYEEKEANKYGRAFLRSN
jgi:hypothetical protein